MRIAFFGSSPLAVEVMEALVDSGTEFAVVYTRPDQRGGRGRHLLANPVKCAALGHSLPLTQPKTWDKAAVSALTRLKADMGVVVAYGVILPQSVIETPRLGCINLHTSKLPRWRGAAPIARTIEAGDTETGISLMQLVPELDAGPVIQQRDCPVEARDTSETLGKRLAGAGAAMLCEFLRHSPQACEEMIARAVPQGSGQVCYARKLSKHEAEIDWRLPADVIDRKIRALNPWPIAQTGVGELTVRIWESLPLELPASGRAGSIEVSKRRLFVNCGRGRLEIGKLQVPGKKVLDARDFLNGYSLDGLSFDDSRHSG